MHTILISTFLFSVIADLLNKTKGYFSVITVILITIAGLRPEGVDRDYSEYAAAYKYTEFSTRIELSFTLISKFLRSFVESPVLLFFVYAFIGVTLKLFAINKMSRYLFLSISFYIAHFYLLHEMTQIRIGVAAGFFLVSIYYKISRNKIGFILTSLLAILFHYSAVIIILLWIVEPFKKSRYLKYYLIPLGIAIGLSGFEILFRLPIPFLQNKLELYSELKKTGLIDMANTNLFNPIIITKIIFYYLILIKIKEMNTIDATLLFVFNVSIFSFYALSFFPVAAFRVSEFLGIVEIVFIPNLISAFKTKKQGKFVFVTVCTLLILMNLLYLKLIL